jgi:peptide/nickel transport system substrate-binding protein
MEPKLNSPARKSLEVIDKISVPDSFTLKIKLKYPFAPFLAAIEMGIVPKHLVEKEPAILQHHPVGSGPFKFVRWKADSYVELAANRGYWQTPPKLDGLMFKIMPEATTRILALEYGEVDFLMNLFPKSYLGRFRSNPRLKIKMRPGSNYVYLGLNMRNSYLKHRQVRQAIAHAIDVQSIIDNLLGGIHKPAKSLLNPSHWAYNPNLPDYDYDPHKAKQLLDEAGFPDPDGDGPAMRFRLNYKCTDKQLSRQKAQIIQQYLGEVGIGIDIQSYEWGTFFDDIQKGRFDMYSLTWVGIYEPDQYYLIFHSSSIGSGANRGGYVNPEIDQLLEQARRTLDRNKRKKLYWRVQEILAEDLPYISLWYETNIAVMDKHVFGFEILPAGEWRSFRKVYFKENLEVPSEQPH